MLTTTKSCWVSLSVCLSCYMSPLTDIRGHRTFTWIHFSRPLLLIKWKTQFFSLKIQMSEREKSKIQMSERRIDVDETQTRCNWQKGLKNLKDDRKTFCKIIIDHIDWLCFHPRGRQCLQEGWRKFIFCKRMIFLNFLKKEWNFSMFCKRMKFINFLTGLWHCDL